jgi:signal transduction histidine kinase
MAMSEEESKKNDLLLDSKQLIGKLITDVKQLAKTLNTNKLHQLNISEVLTEDIARLQRMQLFSIQLQIEGEENNIANDKKIILYRICQELLHNMVKHANAENVLMQLTFTQQQLHILLQDDGEGFDLMEAKQKKLSSGLLNLYNRTQLIGGTLTIDSVLNKGTTTHIYIPTN